jgi:hypothetical protein
MALRLLTSGLWLCFLFSAHVSAESGPPSWNRLMPQQREILTPLAQEWDHMDAAKKKKWLSIAKRYPGMTLEEQQRMQLQMRDWYLLTPEQRQRAREKYKTIKKMPPDKRDEIKQKWRQYEQTPDGSQAHQ